MVLIMSTIISFTSCSDENFIEEEESVEEIFPEPQPYIFATGIISDSEGNIISNATIDYLVDGEITAVTTDEKGVYEIRKLDVSSERIAIRCHSEGFLPKVDILLTNQDQTIERNITLARNEEFSGGPSDQFSALSITDSLISVSGRMINEAGEGLSGIPIIILNLSLSSFVYGITDQDGYWSIAIEPQTDVSIFSFNPCENLEYIIEQISLLRDTDVGDFISSQIQPTRLNFAGFVTDCNTQEGLISGSAQFSFTNSQDIFTVDIINGQYEIEIPQCASAECIDITIISYIAQSGIDSFYCQSFAAGDNFLDFEVCNTANPATNGGYLTTIINDQTTEYNLVGVEIDANNYTISAQNLLENKGVLFVTEGLATSGTFDLAAIVQLGGLEPVYNAGSGFINYQIDSTTTEFLYGSYEGFIFDISNGQTASIEGEFKAAL